MAQRSYFVRTGDGPAAEHRDVYAALDSAEAISRSGGVDAAVSDDRGRVFAFFCKHGGQRDSTMGALSCCEDQIEEDGA